jgi:hypothetical protein
MGYFSRIHSHPSVCFDGSLYLFYYLEMAVIYIMSCKIFPQVETRLEGDKFSQTMTLDFSWWYLYNFFVTCHLGYC